MSWSTSAGAQELRIELNVVLPVQTHVFEGKLQDVADSVVIAQRTVGLFALDDVGHRERIVGLAVFLGDPVGVDSGLAAEVARVELALLVLSGHYCTEHLASRHLMETD
jgi:hypothetical protein